MLFYPFVAGAVAINLFLAGLIAHAVGYSAITPVDAVIWSIPLGIPATWAAGRWVRGLMDEADG
ncbi:hypothetical protein [Ruegeria marisrubri]|uniref:hypothetical protein n=1 Tax=Ruegeria marisrubri TaxID=1685379 RepID=UPI000B1060CF